MDALSPRTMHQIMQRFPFAAIRAIYEDVRPNDPDPAVMVVAGIQFLKTIQSTQASVSAWHGAWRTLRQIVVGELEKGRDYTNAHAQAHELVREWVRAFVAWRLGTLFSLRTADVPGPMVRYVERQIPIKKDMFVFAETVDQKGAWEWNEDGGPLYWSVVGLLNSMESACMAYRESIAPAVFRRTQRRYEIEAHHAGLERFQKLQADGVGDAHAIQEKILFHAMHLERLRPTPESEPEE